MSSFKNAAQLIGEAVVKPVTEQVGEALEEGAQTVGVTIPNKTQPKPNIDPKQVAHDDAVKKQKVMKNIAQFNQQMFQNSQRLNQQNTTEEQKKQAEEEKAKEIKQFEFAKQRQKSQSMAEADLLRKRTRSERKGGAG